MSEEVVISLEINGVPRSATAEPRMLLADFVRDVLGLTGTHVGCEHGVCGACTILFDGHAVRSCLMFAVQANGARLQTIEGLADGTEMHPLQKLFAEHRALQCGFCTPGMLMTALDLVHSSASLDPDQIRIGMSAALCRCTGYEGIVDAVTAYARQVHGRSYFAARRPDRRRPSHLRWPVRAPARGQAPAAWPR